MVRVFTDGACSKNGKQNARASYAFWIPEHPSLSAANIVPLSDPQTNNRGELMAIQKAVDCLVTNFSPSETDIHIYTDSMYSKNCLTTWIPGWISRGWKTADNKDVANRDLIEDIISKLTKFKSYTISHVRAHTGKDDELSKNNAIVDRMAVDVLDPPSKESDTKVIVTQNTQSLLEDCPIQIMGPPVPEHTLLNWCYDNLQKLDKHLLDLAIMTVLQKTAKKNGFNLEKQKVHKTSVYRLTSSNHLIAEGKSIVRQE